MTLLLSVLSHLFLFRLRALILSSRFALPACCLWRRLRSRRAAFSTLVVQLPIQLLIEPNASETEALDFEYAGCVHALYHVFRDTRGQILLHDGVLDDVFMVDLENEDNQAHIWYIARLDSWLTKGTLFRSTTSLKMH